jgi:hypothetical protein
MIVEQLFLVKYDRDEFVGGGIFPPEQIVAHAIEAIRGVVSATPTPAATRKP